LFQRAKFILRHDLTTLFRIAGLGDAFCNRTLVP